jgi:photosystem II stability/assembly factor-like uncharacterized protein
MWAILGVFPGKGLNYYYFLKIIIYIFYKICKNLLSNYIMKENLESSLSNINLDFSNLIIEKSYEIPFAGGWSCVSMSSDGKYHLGVQSSQNGQAFISNDYGITWSLVQYLTNRKYVGNLVSCGLSFDAKYMAIVQKNGFFAISNDYGVTWTIIKTFINVNPNNGPYILYITKNWRGINVSGTGQYMTAVSYLDDPETGGYIYRSYDYGQSWGDYTQYNSIVPRFYSGIVISYTGKIQTILISANSKKSTGQFYTSSFLRSTDYGATWSVPKRIGINSIICAMSVNKDNSELDGKYQYTCEYGGSGIYASSDYGVTWKNVLSNSNVWTYIATSSDGKYVYCSCYIYSYAISNDYGKTWKLYKYNSILNSIATSGDGKIVTIGTLNNNITLSNDFAVNFNIDNNSPEFYYIYDTQISTSGQYQTSAIRGSVVIRSSDFGKKWIEVMGIKNWYGNAMSLTGQYQTLIEIAGYAYISNDYGLTWMPTQNLNIGAINGIKMSGDGKYQSIINGLTNVPGTPGLYNSSDFGVTWKPILIKNVINLRKLAMSLNGKYQTVVDFYGNNLNGGAINISNDYGITFYEAKGSKPYYWNTISMSANGKYQLAATGQTPFYYALSNDYGENWTVSNIFDNSITSINRTITSSTGQFQFMSTTLSNYNVYIYYSMDYGHTWKLLDTSSINYASDMASVSSNGQRIVLSSQNLIYNIYINQLSE